VAGTSTSLTTPGSRALDTGTMQSPPSPTGDWWELTMML
jgi:hypothetical protein